MGMIASSIVIAAVFSAYHIITKQTYSYQEKSNAVKELSLFHSRLIVDFNEAKVVNVKSDNVVVLICLHEEQTKRYEFHDNYSLRIQAGHVDTFAVSINSCKGFLKTEVVRDPEVSVDELRLKLGENQQEIILRRTTDAKSILIQEHDAWIE